jgi:lipopolysaccharide/colanic/teichoic acid biosynthesis glycosyltransferase
MTRELGGTVLATAHVLETATPPATTIKREGANALYRAREPASALRIVPAPAAAAIVGTATDSLVDTLNVGRARHGRSYWALRRGCEVALVVLSLPFLLPLFALIAAAIRWEDGGSVFYSQARIGERLRTFRILKFRTMVPDAASEPAPILDAATGRLRRPSSDEDPRVTRVGRFLRQWSLDELPQVMNIMAGDMALVGPRPLTVRESLEIPAEGFVRYSVPAGLTGLAQIRDREIVRSPSRFNADVEYVNSCSAVLDLRIVLRTFRALRQK